MNFPTKSAVRLHQDLCITTYYILLLELSWN